MRFRWPWGPHEKHPSLVRNEQHFAKLDLSLPVRFYQFVVFDSELTGLNPCKDEIVSLAGIRIRNLRIVLDDYFFSRMRTKKHTPTEGTFIHRITPEQTKEAPEPHIVIPAFVDFCADSLLVGHFTELDLSFLNRATRKTMGGPLRNPCLDSMELAKTLRRRENEKTQDIRKKKWSYNLSRLSAAYGLPIFRQHDALADALQTAYLFIFLVERLRGEGLNTLKDFSRVGAIRTRMF